MSTINTYPEDKLFPSELPDENLEASWEALSPEYSQKWAAYLLGLGKESPSDNSIRSFYGYLYEGVVLGALRQVLGVHISGPEEIVRFHKQYVCPWLTLSYPYFGSGYFKGFSTPDGLSALDGLGIDNLSYPEV